MFEENDNTKQIEPPAELLAVLLLTIFITVNNLLKVA
jgi:hypothetical protein